MKLKKMYSALSCFFICLALVSCSFSKSVITPQKNYSIEVRELTLKYVLVSTSYDIYLANIEKPEYFSDEKFKKLGQESSDYYNWICKTYNALPDEKRKDLKQIFSSKNVTNYMDITKQLGDDSSVAQIVGLLISSESVYLNEYTKAAINDFFPFFYENYLSIYLNGVSNEFKKRAVSLQKQVNSLDIFEFMQKNSGIEYPQKYKPVFYYLLTPISAYSFLNNDEYISTVPRTITNSEDLLRTPFHEYTHTLFKTFTLSNEFIEISNSLRKSKDFEKLYISRYDKIYDWNGWCEENLVNGFASYLSYKYYGQDSSWRGNYYYDYKFYKYLIETKFDPSKISLKQACIEFLKEQIGDK